MIDSKIYNIDETVQPSPSITYLSQSLDPNNPRIMFVNFNPIGITEENFKQFNIKRTNTSSGEVATTTNTQYFTSNSRLITSVRVEEPGNYSFEIDVELNDGRKSNVYSFTQNFDYDLGEATLPLIITEVTGENRVYEIDSSNIHAGNYGYFFQASCNFINQSTGSNISTYILATGTRVTLNDAGIWNVSCSGQTNTGLVANYSTTIEIEDVNMPPIASLSYDIVNPSTKTYEIFRNGSDSDGSIVRGSLTVTSPSGENFNYEGIGSIILDLPESGRYWLIYEVQDNDGVWSDRVVLYIDNLENQAPTADLQINFIGESTYDLDASSSVDPDGVIVNYAFTIFAPDSTIIDLSQADPVLRYEFTQSGNWEIYLYVRDNNGAYGQTSKIVNVEVLPPDPGEEGKATILGIDSDNDGIRDDVQRYIASLGLPSEKKEIIKDYAKNLQVGVTLTNSREQVVENIFNKIDITYCLRSRMSDEEMNDLTENIQIEHYNTKARLTEYFKIQNHFSGTAVVHDTDEATYSEYCN